MLGPSAHIDTFTRDNLPPAAERPDLAGEFIPWLRKFLEELR